MKPTTDNHTQDAAPADAPADGVVVRLRFEGPSFANHELPLKYLRELEQFGEALQELAAYLWLKENPSRRNKPKGFSSSVDLRLGQILRNCVTVELTLPHRRGQMPLPIINGELHKAAVRTCEIFNALDTFYDVLPDASFDALSKLSQFGKRLSENESIAVDVNGSVKASYDKDKRLKLERALLKTQVDDFEVIASIPDLEKSNGHFRFETVDGRVVRAPLPIDKKSVFVLAKALANPEEYCVRLYGKADVSRATGKLIKVTSIKKVIQCPASYLVSDPDELPIWGMLPISDGKTDNLPDKASIERIMSYEEHLYRDAM